MGNTDKIQRQAGIGAHSQYGGTNESNKIKETVGKKQMRRQGRETKELEAGIDYRKRVSLGRKKMEIERKVRFERQVGGNAEDWKQNETQNKGRMAYACCVSSRQVQPAIIAAGACFGPMAAGLSTLKGSNPARDSGNCC